MNKEQFEKVEKYIISEIIEVRNKFPSAEKSKVFAELVTALGYFESTCNLEIIRRGEENG